MSAKSCRGRGNSTRNYKLAGKRTNSGRHIAYYTRINELLSRWLGIRLVRVAQHEQTYDKVHEEAAFAAVSAIERFNGHKISRSIRKSIDDYAIEVFGNKEYAPWLYVYTLVRGEFRPGWIPDNYFGRIIVNLNKDLRVIAGFKSFSNTVLHTKLLPDLAYHIDGILYSRDWSKLGLQGLRKLIGNHAVFVKKDESDRGAGVVKLYRSDLSENTFNRIGNCVIQLPIRQHDFFTQIIPGSVATIRITTVKDKDGSIGMRASYLRLGRSDTAWIQSDNSVRVAIIDTSGRLDCFGYTQDWRRWSRHPDSGFTFAGQHVPKFKDAMTNCVKLHSQLPHFTIIGWDIAINHEGEPKLIEWNTGHCDIKFSEATTGPCFLGLNWEKASSPAARPSPPTHFQ